MTKTPSPRITTGALPGSRKVYHPGVAHPLRVPMREGARSLNVAIAAAMVLAEALRQTDSFP